MSNLFKMASINNDFIANNFNKKTKYYLLSMVFSLIICAAPALLLINLMINIDYIVYIITGLTIIIYLFLFLTDVFYYNAIKNNFKELKIKYNIFMSLIFNLIIVLIIYVIAIIIVGVMFIW